MTEISVKDMRPAEQLLFLHSLWIIKKLATSSLVSWSVVAVSVSVLLFTERASLPTTAFISGVGVVALSVIEIAQTGFHFWMVRHIRNPETYVRSK